MTEEEKKHQKELWKQDRIRARQEEWKKIRSLGTGAKIRYFWDYYKFVLAIVAAMVLVAYLVVTMVLGSRMNTLLYACFLNADELDPDTETLLEDYVEARGGKKKTENIVFDSSVYVNPDSTGTTQQDVAAAIKITSYVGAGALDVFLAPPNVTAYEQESGMLLNLEEILTQEEIQRLGDAGFLYYESEPETDSLTGALVQTERGSGGKEDRAETVGKGAQSEAAADGTGQGETADTDQAGTAGQGETADTDRTDAAGQGETADADRTDAAGQGETAEVDQTGAAGQETSSDGEGQEDGYTLNTRAGDGMHIYAVRIDPAGVIGKYDIYDDDSQVWFSIIGNTPRTGEAVRFLRFLLGETVSEAETKGTQ